MALVVEDGTGRSDADAYLSVEEADTYHSAYGNPTQWQNATEEEKETAIRLASQYLDLEFGNRWRGTKRDTNSGLDWPRFAVPNPDGTVFLDGISYNTLPYDEVPKAVKHATAYMALQSVLGEVFFGSQSDSASVSEREIRVGPITTKTKFSGGGEMPDKAYPFAENMLQKLIYPPGRIYVG